MDSVQIQTHEAESYILKTNLGKFFKIMRVQANSLYCLLVASTVDVAFVDIVGRGDGVRHRRLSVAQFIAQLSNLPTKQVAYHFRQRYIEELEHLVLNCNARIASEDKQQNK